MVWECLLSRFVDYYLLTVKRLSLRGGKRDRLFWNSVFFLAGFFRVALCVEFIRGVR